MRTALFVILFCTIVPFGGTAFAQADMVDTLERIKNSVCIDIPLEGGTISKEATGEAQLGLSKVLKGLLDAGVGGNGGFSSEQYVNVLHEQLDGRVNAQQECQLQVYSDFSPLLQQWLAKQSETPMPESITTKNIGDGNATAVGTNNSVTVNN